MESKILALVERNNILESQHRGWIAVSDENGNLINGTHEKFPSFFARSSLKPLQVLPFLLNDGMKNFGFGLKELAVMCSSHSGEDEHRKTVEYILKEIGLKENNLKCGTHIPYNKTVANKLVKEDKEPTQLFCNCSGKHSGMLALCVLKNYPIENYYEYNHPLQKNIRDCMSEILELDANNLKWAIDGCGVPTYSFPLDNLLKLFSKIVNPKNLEGKYSESFNLIQTAFLKYPNLIAGDGRVDTVIMNSNYGNFVSKIGGEAILGFGAIKEKITFAIKIEDGEKRPFLPIIVKSLELLGFDLDKYPEVKKLMLEPIYNNLNNKIGDIKPVFEFIK